VSTADLATALPAEKWRLQQRAELVRGLLIPSQRTGDDRTLNRSPSRRGCRNAPPLRRTDRCVFRQAVATITDGHAEPWPNGQSTVRPVCPQLRKCRVRFGSARGLRGWPGTRYDDGGFSGGNLERPALQCLLADIRTGRIDIVVVYKVDRLTRSLCRRRARARRFGHDGVSLRRSLSRVRSRLPAGGSRIRTTGPPLGVSLAVALFTPSGSRTSRQTPKREPLR
jgi:Resolvase, N terminal domain